MRSPIVRPAEPHDAEGIARVCAAGWRDTYDGIEDPEVVESVIAEYYTPERISREVGASEGWDGGSWRSRATPSLVQALGA
jgi:hypothetical protein